MKHFKLFFACLLMAVLSIGQMWADNAAVGATLWAENFAHFGTNTPSAAGTGSGTTIFGGATITYAQSSANTKGYNETLAGGTAPELLLAKSNTTWTISGIPTGGATEMALSFKSNKTTFAVTTSTADLSISGSAKAWTITVDEGKDTPATFDLVIKNTGGSNARIDDVALTVVTAAEGGGTPIPTLSVSPAVIDFGSVEVGASVPSETVEVTFANLTGSVTYSGLSGVFSASGSVSATGDEITIAANTATAGDYSQTLTVQSAADELSKTVTVKMKVVAPLTPIAGGVVDELIVSDFGVTSGSYTAFTDKQASNEGHSDAVYAGKVARNGNSTQYNIQMNTIGTSTAAGREIATSTSGGYAKRVQAIWATQSTNTANRKLTVYGSESAYTGSETVATGTKLGDLTYTSGDTYAYLDIDGDYPYIQIVASGAIYMDQINVTWVSSAAAVAKPAISGDENFLTSTEVSITCATDGATIYYTTNGSDPKTVGTEYSGPFSLTESATVHAIANFGSDWSEPASKTFTKVTPMTTAAELRSFATSSAQNAFIQLDGWKVTFVSGNYAYIVDPSNEGVILNNASHGYVAGDELNDEVVEASVKLASGRVQLSGFTSTDITATSGTVSPVDVTDFSTVLAANQSRLITLKNATYASSTGTFSDGEHLIYFYDQFSANPTLVDGTTYDVTGIVIYYKNNTDDKIEIAPRSADDVEAQSPVVIPTAANLAALKAAERGTYILTLTNAVVTYVNGNNAFIEDATGGALIYFASHGYSAGDCLNGDYQVVTTDYQGKFEITAMEPQAGAATTTAEIPLTTVSIATLNADFAAYESKRIKIAGANVTDAISGSDRNGAINDGAALAVYAAVASTITLTADDNVDIIGYPGFHNTDQQLNVWRQEDITVNEKEDPEISYSPATLTIEEGDAWSAPTFNNPHSLAIASYVSSNEAVATVSDGGVIALAGGIGTAVITAHTNGDATYAAGNATYTITVNEAGSYSMSINLSKASYDDAADEEVVWNSNVVTFTADKNDGTKVTNYLAGNYSSGTLIEEVRFYAKNSLSFVPASGVTITKVEWMSTAKGYATKLAAETWTNATAAVDATNDKLVNITPSAAGEFSVTLTDAARATGITVYYQADAEKAKLTASIAIDDMNMAVGDDDILLSAIAATSNPNKKAISYAVTSGTAVSIVGEGAEAALHAVEEGEATITANIPDNLGNYTGATKTFTVTVAAAATLVSIAIDGTATELEYTEGQSFNPAGLTVMGHYSDNSDAEITSGITWTFDPDPLTEGTTSVSVTATVETISSDAFVVNGLTVSGPAPVGDNYVKVTASQTDWSGDYILVYEDGTNAYVWNGDYSDGASNYASATISSNTIAKPAAAAVITIAAAAEGKYTLQVNGDKYFLDNGSNAKLIFTDAIEDAAKVSISYETDWTKLLFSERCIRFNSTAGQTRFRFYGESNQQAVQLYKKDVVTPPTPTPVEVRSGLEIGRHYTICLEKNITNIDGATFWNLQYKNAGNTEVYLVEETAPEAGKPYIIQATKTTLNVVYGDEEENTPVENGALRGTFTGFDVDAFAALTGNVYLLIENAIRPRTTGNYLAGHRAYVLFDELQNVPSAGFAPGKKVKAMPLQGQTPTGCENINASETPVKMIIDGQMFILRGEKMYDATGRLVK